MISIFDAILLIALSGFVFYGFFFGLIRTIGAFAGLLVGVYVTTRIYGTVVAAASPYFFGFETAGKVIVFIILFSLISKAVSFAFYLLDKAFNIIAIIPFLKTFSRLGGAMLGAVIGVLALGFVIYLASGNFIVNGLLGTQLATSKLAPPFLKANNLMLPLVPVVMRKVKLISNFE